MSIVTEAAAFGNRMAAKWSKLTFDGFSLLELPECRIKIQPAIYTELMKVDEQTAKSYFGGLCGAFLKVCRDHAIPYRCADISMFTEEEIPEGPVRAITIPNRDATGEPRSCLIGFSAFAFGHDELLKHVFLHELGHCWLAVYFPDEQQESKEHFTDLVAIVALGRIIPYHKRIYREIFRFHTYFAADDVKKRMGKEQHKEMLENPEAFLVKTLKRLRESEKR
jgi:hypothetical protein